MAPLNYATYVASADLNWENPTVICHIQTLTKAATLFSREKRGSRRCSAKLSWSGGCTNVQLDATAKFACLSWVFVLLIKIGGWGNVQVVGGIPPTAKWQVAQVVTTESRQIWPNCGPSFQWGQTKSHAAITYPKKHRSSSIEVIRIGRTVNKIESQAFITVQSVISIVKYVSSVTGLPRRPPA